MSKTRKKKPTYPPEYRQRIIDLYLSGRSIFSLAADFEPCAATIFTWVRKHEQQHAGDALSSDEREELNPVELCWRWLKSQGIGSRCPKTKRNSSNYGAKFDTDLSLLSMLLPLFVTAWSLLTPKIHARVNIKRKSCDEYGYSSQTIRSQKPEHAYCEAKTSTSTS